MTRHGRLTVAIRTMRVELASSVALRDVYLRQIADAGHLNVIGGLDEVRAGDGARGNHSGSVSRLDTPGDLFTLGVPDGGLSSRLLRSEEAEVVDGIH